MTDHKEHNTCDVQEFLALLQHWFACFRLCGDMRGFTLPGVRGLEEEQRLQQLLRLSADVEKRLFVLRADLAAKEAQAAAAVEEAS